MEGVKVATTPAYVTVPVTLAPPGPASRKFVALMLDGLIAVLKVADSADDVGTFAAPLDGVVERTVGLRGVTVEAVVNVQI
jgi:hypothetical protein